MAKTHVIYLTDDEVEEYTNRYMHSQYVTSRPPGSYFSDCANDNGLEFHRFVSRMDGVYLADCASGLDSWMRPLVDRPVKGLK